MPAWLLRHAVRVQRYLHGPRPQPNPKPRDGRKKAREYRASKWNVKAAGGDLRGEPDDRLARTKA
jgi:hypothetical protein